MRDVDLFEPGTQVFTGTVRAWGGPFAELVTDSGLTVTFTTEGTPAVPEGARVTIVARKYLPLFHVVRVRPG